VQEKWTDNDGRTNVELTLWTDKVTARNLEYPCLSIIPSAVFKLLN
jgi:hypothetical protein